MDAYFKSFLELIDLPATVKFEYDPVMKQINMHEWITDGTCLRMGIWADTAEKAVVMAKYAYHNDFSNSKILKCVTACEIPIASEYISIKKV
jgi:hypothetical protein